MIENKHKLRHLVMILCHNYWKQVTSVLPYMYTLNLKVNFI